MEKDYLDFYQAKMDLHDAFPEIFDEPEAEDFNFVFSAEKVEQELPKLGLLGLPLKNQPPQKAGRPAVAVPDEKIKDISITRDAEKICFSYNDLKFEAKIYNEKDVKNALAALGKIREYSKNLLKIKSWEKSLKNRLESVGLKFDGKISRQFLEFIFSESFIKGVYVQENGFEALKKAMESQNPQNENEKPLEKVVSVIDCDEERVEYLVDILDWGGFDEYEINYYRIEEIVITEKNAIFLGSNLNDSLDKVYYNRPFGYEAPGIYFKAKLVPLSEIKNVEFYDFDANKAPELVELKDERKSLGAHFENQDENEKKPNKDDFVQICFWEKELHERPLLSKFRQPKPWPAQKKPIPLLNVPILDFPKRKKTPLDFIKKLFGKKEEISLTPVPPFVEPVKPEPIRVPEVAGKIRKEDWEKVVKMAER